MNTTEEQRQDTIKDGSDTMLRTTQILIAVWERRRWLAVVAGVGVLVAIGIAVLIPNEYTSTAQLMPPGWRPPSSTVMLGALPGGGGGSVGESLAGSLVGNMTPGATYVGILDSQTVQDGIVHRFDLRRVYHCQLDIDARKRLVKATKIVDDMKDGIISISVTDEDRYRARDMAQAYIQELDNLVGNLSSSSARRERIFLEGRLKSIKADLDGSSRALAEFSSHNATLDLQKQGEATFEAAGKLQAELIAAQSQLYGLKAAYADDNVRVREAQRRVDLLQAQLNKMTGAGANTSIVGSDSGQTLPSVRELPVLGYTYYDLYRKVSMDEALYETLTKQYELARVQEAEQIVPVQVLDPPNVPERKTSPHRVVIVILSFFLSLFAGVVWIVVSKLCELTDDSHPAKALAIALLRRKSG